MFPSLGYEPTLRVVIANFWAATILTLLSLSYLTVTADGEPGKSADMTDRSQVGRQLHHRYAAVTLTLRCRYAAVTDRSQVERQFLVGAMSFFAGWGWYRPPPRIALEPAPSHSSQPSPAAQPFTQSM